MDGSALSVIFVSLGLGYPDRPRFGAATLPKLNASLANRYAFETFTHNGESGRFVQEAQRTLHVWRSGMIIENEGSLDIAMIQREFADMASEVMQHLDVPIFWEPRLEVRATWPAAGGDSTALMQQSVIKINDDQIDQLGVSSVRGVTVEVEAIDDDADHGRHVHVEVGSYLMDPSEMHVSLLLTEHTHFQTTNLIENWVQKGYDYFMENVANFADSITR